VKRAWAAPNGRVPTLRVRHRFTLFWRAVTPIHTFRLANSHFRARDSQNNSHFLAGARGQLANSEQSSPIYFGRLRTHPYVTINASLHASLLLFFPPFLSFLPALAPPLTPLYSYSHATPNVPASLSKPQRLRPSSFFSALAFGQSTHGVGCLASWRPGLRVGHCAVDFASGLLSRQLITGPHSESLLYTGGSSSRLGSSPVLNGALN
jgi:hypothetical protein